MRTWVFITCFLFLAFSSSSWLLSQEVRKDDVPVQSHDEKPLKVFQSSDRISAEFAGQFVKVLLFGVVGAIIFAFLLIAYFFEPSSISKPSLNTQPLRIPGLKRYRREKEEQEPTRIEIEDDL